MRIAGSKPKSVLSLKEDYSNKLPILVDTHSNSTQWRQTLIHDLKRRQQRHHPSSIHASSAPYILLWDELENDWHPTYPLEESSD
ncbi:hypothetical protein [uncultured Neptuniibacter sp.]|uniref:hypothetical protein n=1 Tax=uncultured Neptuniibacter sp. TaxID=502143 RepID=UPI0026375413|nr:hypothetical protein [uncultured Neptuniibacter sp.]